MMVGGGHELTIAAAVDRARTIAVVAVVWKGLIFEACRGQEQSLPLVLLAVGR